MRYKALRISSFAAAAAALALFGCVSRPSVQTQPGPAAVESYAPSTLWEGFAQARLEAADQRARKRLEQLEGELEMASDRYMRAAELFYAENLPAGTTRPTKEELDRLHEAVESAWRRYQDEFMAQVDQYERFLERYPHNWYARHRYAWFLADHHFEYQAAEEWRRVIEMEPRFPFAYNNLGTLYNHMGRDIEAVHLFHKAIELKNDDPVFFVNLAVNYSTHRHDVAKEFGWDLPRVFNECIKAYERARELAPQDREVAYDLASQYVLAKFFNVANTADQALSAWDYYLKLDLTDFQRGVACRNVGRIYLKEKNDPATARKWLERAVELMPDDPSNKALLEQAKAAEQGAKPAQGNLSP